MPSYQNADGTFFAESSGGPILLSSSPAAASTIKMPVHSRALFVNASLLPSLTVWLPPGVEPGEMVDLCFETGVSALSICDGEGVVVASAPTTNSGPGARVTMRHISRSYGWFFWSGGGGGSSGGSGGGGGGGSVTIDGVGLSIDGTPVTSVTDDVVVPTGEPTLDGASLEIDGTPVTDVS